jgi:hypothetical protein
MSSLLVASPWSTKRQQSCQQWPRKTYFINLYLALVSGHFLKEFIEVPHFHRIAYSHREVDSRIKPGKAAVEVSQFGQGIIEAALQQTANLQISN